MHKRVSKGRSHSDRRKFAHKAKPHPMNRVVNFIHGNGLFRGGVQV